VCFVNTTLALLSVIPILALIILSNVDWEVSDLLWGVAICIGALGLFREMDEDPSKGEQYDVRPQRFNAKRIHVSRLDPKIRQYFNAFPPNSVVAFYAGCLRDPDLSERWQKEIITTNYNSRIWVPEENLQMFADEFCDFLHKAHGAKISGDMFHFSTNKTTRRSVKLFDGTLDLVFEAVPNEIFEEEHRYQAVARECAHSEDVAISAIAIDRELTIWALEEYVEDRKSRKISVFPPPMNSKENYMNYALRLKREKFNDYEIIKKGWIQR